MAGWVIGSMPGLWVGPSPVELAPCNCSECGREFVPLAGPVACRSVAIGSTNAVLAPAARHLLEDGEAFIPQGLLCDGCAQATDPASYSRMVCRRILLATDRLEDTTEDAAA